VNIGKKKANPGEYSDSAFHMEAICQCIQHFLDGAPPIETYKLSALFLKDVLNQGNKKSEKISLKKLNLPDICLPWILRIMFAVSWEKEEGERGNLK